MDFTTIIFPIFLFTVYTLWRSVSGAKGKIVLMAASFFFYGYWFPPYLLLLLTSGGIDYWAAKKLHQHDKKKTRLCFLLFSLITNLSLLFYFKYANFFLDTIYSFRNSFLNSPADPYFIHVILPVGISFYTFQSISYTVDVYRKKLAPCDNYIDFFLYLSFFPQLVAGPIVRAIDFLPQLEKQKQFSWADCRFSLYRICRGYFLKVFIADQISVHSNAIFGMGSSSLDATTAWLGAACFTIQIFCDFSGYSDIAIGISRLFGFKILENFRNPYFALGMEDFWRRWHISLSTWFRDYLYIPLGGSRCSKLRTEFNIMTVFVVSGLWHGANWTYLFWGLLNGIVVFADKLIKQTSFYHQAINWQAFRFALRTVTLIIVIFLWVPFRAPDLQQAFSMWSSMLSLNFIFSVLANQQRAIILITFFCIYCAVQFFKEIRGINDQDTFIQRIETALYFSGILVAPWKHTDFIYFQF